MITNHFPVVTKKVTDNGFSRVRLAVCLECGKTGEWTDSTAFGAPDERVAHGFRHMGWQCSTKGDAICCECLAMREQKRRAKRAAKVREVARIVPPPAPPPEPPVAAPEPTIATHIAKEEPVQAEQPRQPTRDDRRKIMDALEEHYDHERGMYVGSFSDEAVAAKLKMPRAWVSEERERYFGPDTNEAAAREDAKVAELEKRITAAIDRAMIAAGECEALMRELKALRAGKRVA